MHADPLFVLAAVVCLGVLAQWTAWRLRWPSILLLLSIGILVGPISGFVRPAELFGDSLFPIVSLCVAILLFEGGLTLELDELREVGATVVRLISVGVLITWLVAAGAAVWLLGLPGNLAVLFGALLTVSGPTVVGPLLRQVRPDPKIGSLLKWEGILNDPVGALLAVLIYEAILVGRLEDATLPVALGLLKTAVAGAALGWLGARALLLFFKRHWVPDGLQSPVALVVVFAVFVATNAIQHEAGLLSVTVLGILLANQHEVRVRHVIEFKENLRVILLAILFVLLAARIEREDLQALLALDTAAYVAVLCLVARPLAVVGSTIGSGLSWRERTFLACMAPRGIVAAAVASVFAIGLEQSSIDEASRLAPLTFAVIIGTVTFYGLVAGPAARLLGLARGEPQGVLIVGAHEWARQLAGVLHRAEVAVLLVDSNAANIRAARLDGLRTWWGSAVSETLADEIDLGDLGNCLALTPNDELNALVAMHFVDDFGRAHVYQLPPEIEDGERLDSLVSGIRGRSLFRPEATHHEIADRVALGAVFKRTRLTEEFDWGAFREHYGESAWPLFVKTGSKVVVVVADREVDPQPGDEIIALVDDPDHAVAEGGDTVPHTSLHPQSVPGAGHARARADAPVVGPIDRARRGFERDAGDLEAEAVRGDLEPEREPAAGREGLLEPRLGQHLVRARPRAVRPVPRDRDAPVARDVHAEVAGVAPADEQLEAALRPGRHDLQRAREREARAPRRLEVPGAGRLPRERDLGPGRSADLERATDLIPARPQRGDEAPEALVQVAAQPAHVPDVLDDRPQVARVGRTGRQVAGARPELVELRRLGLLAQEAEHEPEQRVALVRPEVVPLPLQQHGERGHAPALEELLHDEDPLGRERIFLEAGAPAARDHDLLREPRGRALAEPDRMVRMARERVVADDVGGLVRDLVPRQVREPDRGERLGRRLGLQRDVGGAGAEARERQVVGEVAAGQAPVDLLVLGRGRQQVDDQVAVRGFAVQLAGRREDRLRRRERLPHDRRRRVPAAHAEVRPRQLDLAVELRLRALRRAGELGGRRGSAGAEEDREGEEEAHRRDRTSVRGPAERARRSGRVFRRGPAANPSVVAARGAGPRSRPRAEFGGGPRGPGSLPRSIRGATGGAGPDVRTGPRAERGTRPSSAGSARLRTSAAGPPDRSRRTPCRSP